MNRIALALLAGLFLTPAAAGQHCIVVCDAGTRSPIVGGRVLGMDGALLAITAPDGRFCLVPPLPEGIVVEAEGHHPRAAMPLPPAGDTLFLEPLRVDLPEVHVTPWPHLTLGGAVMTATEVDSVLLEGFERSGLRSAMVWVPGVQMDARGHGGSTRLSIRGSLLRSPFGVRGVKVYWGPFPITLADGSTPLELLDPALVGGLRVVRSTGAPGHGSAPSGLLLAEPPWPSHDGGSADASVSGGSYGFRRASAIAGLSGNGSDRHRTTLVMGLTHQRNDGYREQESSARDQVFIASRRVSGRTVLRTQLTLQRTAWGLPGSLDSLTAATTPRSARPFSRSIDARLEKTQAMAGVAMEQGIGSRFRLMTTVHAQAIEKLNPYGTTPAFSGYKEESTQAGGSRLVLRWEKRAGKWNISAGAGVEALTERDRMDERAFKGTEPDTFRTRADTRVGNLNAFAELRLLHGRGTDVFLALGMERTRYDHHDMLTGARPVSARPGTAFPVLGLSQRVLRDHRVGLRYGGAVSRPTVWELLGTAGRFSPELAPERVSEWELTLERAGDSSVFSFQVAGYMRRVSGLIQPFPEPDGTGEYFANAGSADLRGAEAMLGVRPRRPGPGGWRALCTIGLQEYRLRPSDGGAVVPVHGVPGVTAGAVLRWAWARVVLMEAGARHVGSIPVGRSGQDRLPAYTLLHLRAERDFRTGAKGSIGVFVHVENLGGTAHTAFAQINDPGGRYHNPAPGRSLFAGVSFRTSG